MQNNSRAKMSSKVNKFVTTVSTVSRRSRKKRDKASSPQNAEEAQVPTGSPMLKTMRKEDSKVAPPTKDTQPKTQPTVDHQVPTSPQDDPKIDIPQDVTSVPEDSTAPAVSKVSASVTPDTGPARTKVTAEISFETNKSATLSRPSIQLTPVPEETEENAILEEPQEQKFNESAFLPNTSISSMKAAWEKGPESTKVIPNPLGRMTEALFTAPAGSNEIDPDAFKDFYENVYSKRFHTAELAQAMNTSYASVSPRMVFWIVVTNPF